MTENEAIMLLKLHHKEVHEGVYKDAVFMAIQALEKQIPKKPIIKNWCPAICPTCGCELSESLGDGYYKHYEGMKYCECGQALDWQ